jgi:SAM-dependent methyltransferase
VAEWTDERLRTTFEEVPDLYDRARPTYPDELFVDLAELAQLPEHARIVEIGPGTGKATVALARRGYRVTGVELGQGLAAVARRNLALFPDAEVVEANFETWQPAEAAFDAVVAFTAFHWIGAEARYARPAALLRPGGALAVAATQHVLLPGGDEFFLDVHEDYVDLQPESPHTHHGPPRPPDEIDGSTEEIAASGLFRNVAERRYLWDVVYDADEYLAVLATYSSHRAMEPDALDELFRRIRRRVEARPGGTVRKTYLALLNVAERL